MAIKLEVYEKVDGRTVLNVLPSVANEVKTCWLTKKYKSDKQKQFVNNVMKIRYSPEQVFCLHRYYIKQHFVIGKSKAYIMGCRNCEFIYPTDTLPANVVD